MTLTAPRASAVLVLGLLAALPGPLRGQATPSPESPDSPAAHIHLEADARVTSLRSTSAVLLGASGRFDLGGPFSFGAGGWVLTEPLEVAARDPGTGLRLRMAYAGLVTAWSLPTVGAAHLRAQVLWGAGNAKMELPLVGTEIAADNFLVVEPGVAVSLDLRSFLQVVGGASYRWVGAVEDLPGVGGEQLRGLSASLGLAIGPF